MPQAPHRKLLLFGGNKPLTKRISGLQLWLDASKLSGFVDGDPVGTWPDLSGNNKNATQSTAGARPIYKTNVQNGKPAVRFDPTDDGMITTLTLTLPYTIIAVYSRRNGPTGTHQRAVNGSNNWLMGPYGGTNQTYNGAFINGPGVTLNQAVIHVITQASGAANQLVRAAGVSSSGSNANSGAIGTLGLGASGAVAEALDGDMFSVLAYNKVISASEQSQLLVFLQSEFGIA